MLVGFESLINNIIEKYITNRVTYDGWTIKNLLIWGLCFSRALGDRTSWMALEPHLENLQLYSFLFSLLVHLPFSHLARQYLNYKISNFP